MVPATDTEILVDYSILACVVEDIRKFLVDKDDYVEFEIDVLSSTRTVIGTGSMSYVGRGEKRDL